MDNIDSKAKGNFSLDEFHGYALSVTNHLSHKNPGVKRTPIKLDPSDKSTPNLPDSYMIQPPVELAQSNVFAPRHGENEVRRHHDVQCAKIKDEAWIAHATRVLNQGMLEEGDVITWSGFNSLLASDESVKPPAEIGVYPLFPERLHLRLQ